MIAAATPKMQGVDGVWTTQLHGVSVIEGSLVSGLRLECSGGVVDLYWLFTLLCSTSLCSTLLFSTGVILLLYTILDT